MKRHFLAATVGLLVIVASACGSEVSGTTDDDSACLLGDTDCADDPTRDTTDPDTDSACLAASTHCADDPTSGFSIEEARLRARGVLGTPASDLPDDVRIGRIGDDHQPLTADYQLGRLTVGLDHDGSRVVDVTVELPDGSETFRHDES